jgi:hypothetical protein
MDTRRTSTFSGHFSAIWVPEIDNVEYEKKNYLDWIEEQHI